MGYFISQNSSFALNIMRGLSAKLRNATKEIGAMQELLLMANKSTPTKAIDLYIQRHTEYAPDGTPHFRVKIYNGTRFTGVG